MTAQCARRTRRRRATARRGRGSRAARRRPAVVDALVDAVDDGHQPGGERDRAGAVDGGRRCRRPAAGTWDHRRSAASGQADGDVDQEDPLPTRPVDEQAARDHPDGSGTARRSAAKIPSAFVRAAPSANVPTRIDSAAVPASAAPRPWMRPRRHELGERSARPAASDATENSASPPSRIRRRPSRSAAGRRAAGTPRASRRT